MRLLISDPLYMAMLVVAIRQHHGWTIAEFCEHAGIDRHRYHKLQNPSTNTDDAGKLRRLQLIYPTQHLLEMYLPEATVDQLRRHQWQA